MAAELSHLLSVDQMKHKYVKTVKDMGEQVKIPFLLNRVGKRSETRVKTVIKVTISHSFIVV